MVVGELPEAVDLLVIGGGPGGYVAALRAAQLGREVTLVELADGERGLGGTCVHVGCIPSKALIELADSLTAVERMSLRGLRVERPSVDLAAFQLHKDAMVRGLSDAVGRLLSRHGVRVVAGTARLTAPHRAAVERPDEGTLFFEYADVVVATGSRPATLAALPVDGVRVLDSTGALALDRLPGKVAVVGGGVIGLELASAMRALGAAVTVIEMADQLLPGTDAAIAGVIRRSFARRGIEVLTGTRVGEDDGAELSLWRGPDTDAGTLAADVVVVAVGRRPNSEIFAPLGIELARDGTVPVGSDRLAAPHVAVIGDLTAGPALAHKATAEGRVAAEVLCGRPSAYDPAAMPAVVYTEPEVALAGESEASAAAAGLDVAVTAVPFGVAPRSATAGATEGLARILSEPSTGVVLGVQIVGRNASELIAEGVLAIEMGATVEDLALTIHAHPTLSEVLVEAAHLAAGAPVHATA